MIPYWLCIVEYNNCKMSHNKSSDVLEEDISIQKDEPTTNNPSSEEQFLNSSSTSLNISLPTPYVQPRPKVACKNSKCSYVTGGKKFVWKALKQILAQERTVPWPDDAVFYSSLNAPPSLKPARKYSDISGLESPYTDPQTKLHYHNIEEFKVIRDLPSDIIQGYLALRGATNVV